MMTVISWRGNIVEVHFSDKPAASEHEGEISLDINPNGNWITGIELFGAELPFSLQQALASLSPEPHRKRTRAPIHTPVVTYDAPADAAYLYLPYLALTNAHAPHDIDSHNTALSNATPRNLDAHNSGAHSDSTRADSTRPDAHHEGSQLDRARFMYSCSIEPRATFRLAADQTLVSIEFKIPTTERTEIFMHLFAEPSHAK
jgi:uncharacterized protein YuzE